MGNFCPAREIAACVKAERLEAETIDVSANMAPYTMSGCFLGLGYAGGGLESRPSSHEGRQGRKRPYFSACLTVAESYLNIPRPFQSSATVLSGHQNRSVHYQH